LANALRERGFSRPPGSPRLITRLRRIKELQVSRAGTIRLVDNLAAAPEPVAPAMAWSAPLPATANAVADDGVVAESDVDEPGIAPREGAAENAVPPANPSRRRRRRGGRRRRGRRGGGGATATATPDGA